MPLILPCSDSGPPILGALGINELEKQRTNLGIVGVPRPAPQPQHELRRFVPIHMFGEAQLGCHEPLLVVISKEEKKNYDFLLYIYDFTHNFSNIFFYP